MKRSSGDDFEFYWMFYSVTVLPCISFNFHSICNSRPQWCIMKLHWNQRILKKVFFILSLSGYIIIRYSYSKRHKIYLYSRQTITGLIDITRKQTFNYNWLEYYLYTEIIGNLDLSVQKFKVLCHFLFLLSIDWFDLYTLSFIK